VVCEPYASRLYKKLATRNKQQEASNEENMKAEYMHTGIPVTTKKPNMTYVEALKIWISNPDDYTYKIEYVKFEEETPFPEIIHRSPHVAFKVDNIEKHLEKADEVIFPATEIGPGVRIAFALIDGTIFEFYEEN
jgi:hypothetical protein